MNEAGIGKAHPTKNSYPQPYFYLCGDGDGDENGFGGGDGDGDGKAILGPVPLPSLILMQ